MRKVKDQEQEPQPEPSELNRFEQLARALFHVDKKDVPKHEPKKREKREESLEP